MRSGNWRGQAVAIALALVCGPIVSARADLFHHTIPRETLALDYRTGDVMMAPPIPGGHYTKDYAGCVKNAAGLSFGMIHGLVGKAKGLCSRCGGPSCGTCGGKGLFNGLGCGSCGGDGCGSCGSDGWGSKHGGLFHHGDGGFGHKAHGSHFGCSGPGCGAVASAQVAATPVAPAKATGQAVVHPAAQQVMPSGQFAPVCGGCLGTGRLVNGGGCGQCGGCGRLKGLFGHHGGGNGGSVCGGCGGNGCGSCGGKGFLSGLGHGGGNGNGMGSGCGACGGRGCGLCAGLKGKAHSLMGLPLGLYSKVTHKGQIKYFVGPGGPVPLTPGYVPYVVTTRSPRDFFAFPPFSDQIP